MYLLSSERGLQLQHLILHLWCSPQSSYLFTFNIFMTFREQWSWGCSAREGEPGAKGRDPWTRAPSHGTQTRGAEQVWDVTRAANGPNCQTSLWWWTWSWSQAGKASQQVSIGQGWVQAYLQCSLDKDHGPALSSKAAPEPGGGPQQGFSQLFFTQLFSSSCSQGYSHIMPELVLSTNNQSWKREEAAELVGALSRLKLRKNKSGMNGRPRPLKESQWLFLCVWRYIASVGQFSL